MSCPICEKRPPKRFCPAKGEKICAICCGEEREVTIDCPLDCSYLIAAHRYEAEHRKRRAADEIPYRNVEFSVDFIYERWPQVTGLAATILAFQIQNRELDDAIAFVPIEPLTPAGVTRKFRAPCMGNSLHSSTKLESRPPKAWASVLGRIRKCSSCSCSCCASASRKPTDARAPAPFSASSARSFLFLPKSRKKVRASFCPEVKSALSICCPARR